MDSTALFVRMGSEDGERPIIGIRRKRRRNADLSEDLIADILARLPVKSLLRFKSVCKLWYSLIVSPNFIALHRRRKKNVSHHFIAMHYSCTKLQTTDVSFRFGDFSDKLTFPGHMKSVEIVGCSNGVVCLSLSQRRLQKYILWNPATKQVRQIGSDGYDLDFVRCGDGCYSFGFCFDAVANAFRVTQIKLTVIEDNSENRAQVQMFSTATDSWTKKNIHVPNQIRCWVSNAFSEAISVNRYIYRHVGGLHPDPEDFYILRYDMIDEVFKRVELPFSPFNGELLMADYKGSLAMFVREWERPKTDRTDDIYTEVEVWVMDDCGGANQSWSKLLTCRPSIEVGDVVGFFTRDNIDFVIMEKEPSGRLYLYNLKNGKTRLWKKEPVSEIFLYSESLASFN